MSKTTFDLDKIDYNYVKKMKNDWYKLKYTDRTKAVNLTETIKMSLSLLFLAEQKSNDGTMQRWEKYEQAVAELCQAQV